MQNKNHILAVGSVALDSIQTPFGKVKEALGGSATFFSASARFFAPVSVVAVVGKDFPNKHLVKMRNLGVDTRGIQVENGKTFRWQGRYDYDLNNAQTLKTQLNVFQSFRPVISSENKKSRFLFLANIDPDLQMAVLRQVQKPVLTACDTMNYWIETQRKSLLRLLKKVDIFLCNDSESRELSGEASLIGAARWILSRGPGIVVIKKGEHGVLCISKKFIFAVPAYLLERVFDPTGCGDTFAGGFIGYLTRTSRFTSLSIRQAVIVGSVLASYNAESFSIDRIAALTREEIDQRVRKFKEMTSC